MGRNTVLAGLLIALLIFAGCESMGQKTTTGAVAGGLIGATAGGIIGHNTGRHGLEGAAIGAAVGALGGGLIGNQMDKKSLESNPNYLTTMAIVEMASKGAPDGVIISEIQRTHSTYNLTSEIIAYLKQNKVSDKVIDYMLSTGSK